MVFSKQINPRLDLSIFFVEYETEQIGLSRNRRFFLCVVYTIDKLFSYPTFQHKVDHNHAHCWKSVNIR